LGQSGAVEEPAQHEHGLLEAAQRASSLAGPGRDPVVAQEAGQVFGGGPLHIEHGGVCDTDRHVRPLGQNNLSQDRSYQGPYACPDLGTARPQRKHRDHSERRALTGKDSLDYDRLKNTRNVGIAESLITSHSVGKNYWASVVAYRTGAFCGKKPESWADFWDTKAFPGSRALQGPDAGPPELEFALLADGVPRDRLYPLDVDRAFRVLDEIKGKVREFWVDGASPGLLLESKKVVASSVWHGRLDELIEQGNPLAYQWNGARRQSNGFSIPNGAANVDAAYKSQQRPLRGLAAQRHPAQPVLQVQSMSSPVRAVSPKDPVRPGIPLWGGPWR
jgi:hypothetical protein